MASDELTKEVPHLYLDTQVFVDLLLNRAEDSLELADNIRAREWLVTTSTFTFMEILDAIQEEEFVFHERERSVPFRNIYRTIGDRLQSDEVLSRTHISTVRQVKLLFPMLFYQILTVTGWEEAADLSGKTDVDAADCIHLATAKINNCDLFVTKDTAIIRKMNRQLSGYIQLAQPRDVDARLKEMNFSWDG